MHGDEEPANRDNDAYHTGGGEVYTSPYRFHRLFKKKEEKKKDKRNDAAGRPTAFLSHSNGLKKGVV